MNGLFLHTGNRLESLAAELATVVDRPLESPLTPEIVIVQSLGMRRWLSLQLAERLGVCLNFQFPFPQAFLDETLRKLVPEMAPADAFQADSMAWRIHRLLLELLEEPQFAPVRQYLADGDGLKLYQLAARLAGLFDQYLVYRPDMVLEWENLHASAPLPESQAWQAMLWRELNRDAEVHFAAALRALAAGLPPNAELPERLSIFGISSLPPAQMQVFFQLASVMPVHLFLLAPCCEYFGDDLTPKQRARRGLSLQTNGNPLLTSLGKLNAQFTAVLIEADERAGHRTVDAADRFEEPGRDSLLHTIQEDVLHARNRDRDAFSDCDEDRLEPLPVSPADRSLQVHVCHSPVREVEALHDQLLDLFAHDRALRPRDIVVMTPDIESYAPLIHAVFEYPENSEHRIPFSIADRAPQSANPLIAAFLALLGLPGTRCTAPQVFSLLQSQPFRQRFGFDDEELARIRQWIREAGIRWGVDAAHRSELGVPAFNENTWRHGIDRLLLGYAMTGQDRTTFEGILPQDDVEGSIAELVGRLAAALEAIFSATETLTHPRPLSDWPEALRALSDRFFSPPGDAPEDVRRWREAQSASLCDLQAAIDRFQAVAREAGPEQIVEFASIREHITSALGETEQRGGFLTGGVTFCALKPMRSIPARVIWLLGMNDGAFPRQAQPPQFDLIAAEPKLGDRSVRDDDRYLFLEALLSARDRLYISHVGRSLVDREQFPPSIVVSELLDYLDRSCTFPEPATNARGWLTFEHRLHAFSRAYFEPGGRLFSYSAANCGAAAIRTPSPVEPPLLTAPLAGVEGRNVELAGFIRFFDNPAAAFLRERLGIRIERDEAALAECEPMDVEPLAGYQVRKEMLDRRAANGAPSEEAVFTARGLLPPGSLGVQYHDSLQRKVDAFYAKVHEVLGTTERDAPQPIDLRVGLFTLTGRLEALYSGRLAFFRPADVKPRDRTRAWIQHLVWCAASAAREDASPPEATFLAGNEDAFLFPALSRDDSIARLLALLEIYRAGMQRPLPFFPMTSFEFATPRKSQVTPLDRARGTWRGGFKEGEKEDPAYAICFGDRDPLDVEFETLADAVFGGMPIDKVKRKS